MRRRFPILGSARHVAVVLSSAVAHASDERRGARVGSAGHFREAFAPVSQAAGPRAAQGRSSQQRRRHRGGDWRRHRPCADGLGLCAMPRTRATRRSRCRCISWPAGSAPRSAASSAGSSTRTGRTRIGAWRSRRRRAAAVAGAGDRALVTGSLSAVRGFAGSRRASKGPALQESGELEATVASDRHRAPLIPPTSNRTRPRTRDGPRTADCGLSIYDLPCSTTSGSG